MMNTRSLFNSLLVCCLLFNGLTLQGQNTGFRVFYEFDSNEDYVFYCENKTGADQHLVVSFSKILGLRADRPLPFDMNVGDGKRMLFKLKKEGMHSQKDFSYGYTIYEGKGNPKVKEVEYVVPVKPGNSTEIRHLSELREILGLESSSKEFFGLAFKANLNDTIYAMRSGKVKRIIDNREAAGSNLIYSAERNRIEITHPDGTVAKYFIYKSGSSLIEKGQEILAGTPLALVTGENYDIGAHFRVTISYLKYQYDKDLDYRQWYSFGYVIPKFRTSNNGLTVLGNGNEYQAEMNDDLITQEMNKRARKKYLKSKKN